MAATNYGNITPRVASYAIKNLLERAIPHLVFEKFGQTYPLPKRSSKEAKFRRYNSLAYTGSALTEGGTPAATSLTSNDETVELTQYGDLVTISDQVQDFHEDPVLMEATEVLAEQAANVIEYRRFEVLSGGSNVAFANGAANRAAVANAVSLGDLRKAIRTLKAANARYITKAVRSTPNYATQNVQPAYVAVVHPDVEADLRGLTGFVPSESYGSMSPFESEIGKVEGIRFLTSTMCAPTLDAGVVTASADTLLANETNVDVYPILIFGANAYGLVPLKGKESITPMVVNPGNPSDSDPLGQRGHVGWKCYTGTVITNDLWMLRLEVGVTENPS